MARSPVYEMALTATNGELPHLLSELRGDGFSYERIATELAIRYGFVVAGMTVQRWIERLDTFNGSAA